MLPLPESTVPTAAAVIQPSTSPRFPPLSPASSPFDSHRKIAIAVDLSEESAFAVRWAVQNYLRPGDSVILLHVRPTSVFYGADWGGSVRPGDSVILLHVRRTSVFYGPDWASIDLSVERDEESQQKLEDDFDVFTNTKANDLGQPLIEAQIPFKLHIVKDHDMKERLCLEVERLGLSAVIMGSRGFGASSKKIISSKGRLGSVSDYCVQHCVCPVVVVRFADEKNRDVDDAHVSVSKPEEIELHPVPEEEEEEEEEEEYQDASADEQKKGN